MTENAANDGGTDESALTRKSFLKATGLGLAGVAVGSTGALGESVEAASGSPSQDRIVFFDDHRIDSRAGVERVVHEAEKRDEPVLWPSEPWESGLGTEVVPDGNVYFYGTVMYDEDDERYEMWYTTFWVEGDFEEYGYYICYATSEDGLDWERPELGIVEYDGSTDNNILLSGGDGHPLSVIRDSPADSEYVASGDSTVLFESSNGLHWEYSDAGLPSPETGGPDAPFAAYDSAREEFFATFQSYPEIRDVERRTIFLSRSGDFETWSEPRQVLAADERDDELARENGNDHAEAYHMPVINYGGVYVGFLSLMFAGGGEYDEGVHEDLILQLAFSRDLENWVREDRGSKIPLGDDNEFDSSMLYTGGFGRHGSQPLVVDDEIRVYYGGWDGPHNTTERGAAVGLATWRLDGFASLANDGDGVGTITTEPVAVDGDRLLVNADLENEGRKNGRLDVEVLDVDGNVVEGFDREACVTVRGDEVDRAVNWRGPANVRSLAGEEIKLRFYLEDGHLYAAQFDDGED